MKILITGGAGFIGSNAARIFTEKGHSVVCLDNLYLGDAANVPAKATFMKGDACESADLRQCGTDFDAIIALAGTSSAPMFSHAKKAEKNSEMPQMVWAYQNSISSFVQTLEFALQTGVKKVLYASTSSLYGNNPMPLHENQSVTPPNHYAVTKFAYEHIAQCYARVHKDLDIIGFRFMSVYGPNEEPKGRYANMISQFVWDAVRGLPPVIYGDGEQFRDFTHVKDVVQGLELALATKGLGADVFNIGRGESTSFNAIFEEIQTQVPQSVPPIYIPNPVKEGYVKGQHADISKIQSALGFAPKVPLKEGLKGILAHIDLKKIRETSSDLIREKFL